MENDLTAICTAIPCSSDGDLSTQAARIYKTITGGDKEFNLQSGSSSNVGDQLLLDAGSALLNGCNYNLNTNLVLYAFNGGSFTVEDLPDNTSNRCIEIDYSFDPVGGSITINSYSITDNPLGTWGQRLQTWTSGLVSTDEAAMMLYMTSSYVYGAYAYQIDTVANTAKAFIPLINPEQVELGKTYGFKVNISGLTLSNEVIVNVSLGPRLEARDGSLIYSQYHD